MDNRVKKVGHRVLVTGSRGKSSLVRLIFAGLVACGLDVRGRITGVLPRELRSGGDMLIVRNSPSHVGEIRWWLRQLPKGLDAIVMENSAIRPELQHLAARWLVPTLTVLTNARPDHEDAWGPGAASAIAALMRGVPDDGILLVGGEVAESDFFREKISSRIGPLFVAEGGGMSYRESNLALAARALDILGLSCGAALDAMECLVPDVADFRIFTLHDEPPVLLASAFSANDPLSTEALFESTGWAEEETIVIYSDRPDRRARFDAFRPFLSRRWRGLHIVHGAESMGDFESLLYRDDGEGKKFFGCGNTMGIALEFLLKLEREGFEWTLPGA